MKTIVKILSRASFFVIVLIVGTGSIYVGGSMCNYLRDLVPFFQGQWTCLLLVPVFYIVSLSVCGFFILGFKQMAKGMNS